MKIISFATQKGGSGKSTLTLVLAAALAVDYKLKVAVLDCDYQQSIVKTRVQIDEESLQLLKESNPDATYPFDIFSIDLNGIFDFVDNPENDYDLVFIDVPGRADGDDVFNALTACDAVIVPLVADYLDRASTAEFMHILQTIKTEADKAEIPFEYFGISTKRSNNKEEQEMDDYVDALGLARFKSSLSYRAAYKRASTLYSLTTPAYLRYVGGDKNVSEEIHAVCNELIERMELPVKSVTE
ncbi:ParA family protein [Rufibacter sediminis]|uniref:ParA family protein n=2 Tax=Rufibacter TaxID=1379908 RepID=A0ABR6VM28_9BACT|nr:MULTISPECIES: ParA family protein [Rufibacter]MBC3538264.1 ParA family protein [Rufibacter sediminis]